MVILLIKKSFDLENAIITLRIGICETTSWQHAFQIQGSIP